MLIDAVFNKMFVCLLSLWLFSLQFTKAADVNSVVTIARNGTAFVCPSLEKRGAALQQIRASIQTVIQNHTDPSLETNLNCGDGLWKRVGYLNMSDPSQQCPSAWREYNSNGVRACGRPESESGSCPATVYSTGRQYNRVCGRVIGYQVGSTDAFGYRAQGEPLDSYYVYGVSITYGSPRNHIWTLAGGTTDLSQTPTNLLGYNCPCADPINYRVLPPSFVGDNYYCESGNSGISYSFNYLYSSDPLWDGQQCEGECCSNGKSPPWFSVELPNPTTDDIEVRICAPEWTRDDTPIQLLELYVQ